MVGELPFVGRADELAALHAWLDEAIESGPRIVALRGEAGMGKTRLLDRFAADVVHRRVPVTVLRATCHQDAQVPYLPLATALRPIGDLLARLHPLGDDTPEHADQRRLHLYLGTADLVERAAADTTLLLVVDDLHWADRGTLDLLGHLLHVISPMMTVLPHRPVIEGPLLELTDRLQRVDHHRELSLSGLDAFSLHDLVEELTGERPARRLLDGLAEASGGNPLLVRSLLARLEAFGVLTINDGLLTHRGGEELLAGPAELDSLLRHRLRDLSRPCLELLVIAAFLGEGEHLDGARAVMSIDQTRFGRAVEEAVHAGVLRDDEIIAFEHPQLRHVMYQRPRGARRHQLHLKVADHLESLDRDGPGRDLGIAHHLRRAGDLPDADRVIRACLAAASQAAAVVAWGEAALCYDAAIDGLERIDEGPSALVGLLHARSAYAHWYNHDNRSAVEHATAAVRIARAIGDLQIWAEALVTLAHGLWSGEGGAFGTRHDLRPFDEFLDTAGEREPDLRARVLRARSTLRMIAFAMDEARADSDAARQLVQTSDDLGLVGDIEYERGAIHFGDIELAESAARFERARECCEAAGNELHLVTILRGMAMTHWAMGALDNADAAVRRAMEAAPLIAAWAECSTSTAVAAGIAVARGRFDDAEALAATAERLLRWAGYPPTAQLLYPVLASGRLLQGDFAGAHRALDQLASASPAGINRFRALLHARAGERDKIRPWGARPAIERPAMFDVAQLAVAIEIGDLIDDADRIAWAAPGIEAVARRGLQFDIGWGFFIPRLAGVAALRLGRLDDAEQWLAVAADDAERAGAVVESARVAVDQDRVREAIAARTP